VTALAGAVIAPFVVFVAPVARLYWLITGRRLSGPFGLMTPTSYIIVIPFNEPPAEVRELLQRRDYNPEPGSVDMPRWFRIWGWVAGILLWQPPRRRDDRW
jgi:hypothetical protein